MDPNETLDPDILLALLPSIDAMVETFDTEGDNRPEYLEAMLTFISLLERELDYAGIDLRPLEALIEVERSLPLASEEDVDRRAAVACVRQFSLQLHEQQAMLN